MDLFFSRNNIVGKRSMLLYGHFLEHFHRQVYGGVWDPGNPLSDEYGFRMDVLDAMRRIRVPIIRWPGGCFVSSYHWRDGVGPDRIKVFDKAWRVEESNCFGTDEYAKLVSKLGCEGYICTNAGTGSIEEMSDWLEYCNLKTEGKFASMRIANGFKEPYAIKYWSIGNENYGSWELGAKSATEWGGLVREAAKLMKHVDPSIELSAAALPDIDWNVSLLKEAGRYLDWISIHEYWDPLAQENHPSTYEHVIAMTKDIGHSIKKVRGLLDAMGLSSKIRIAFDEWNLRGWHHPNVHTVRQGVLPEEYIIPRDKNDDNSQYTMADAVFSACFLNELNRNCDIVGMAAFAPIVNTRGCIFTYEEGIVLRSTYFVFDLYVNHMGDVVLRSWSVNEEYIDEGNCALDVLVTAFSDRPGCAIAVVNKCQNVSKKLRIHMNGCSKGVMHYISAASEDSYNDRDRMEICIRKKAINVSNDGCEVLLPPHSVSVLELE